MSLNSFAQVRSQLVSLCTQERFAAAHMYLVGAGYPADRFPGLWEYLSRRSALSKDGVIAHEARQVLWQAGMRGADLALEEARHYLRAEDWKSAAFVLGEVFGARPSDREAHFLLAECHLLRARSAAGAARTRTDRATALETDAGFDPETPAEAAVLVDLLRFSGALERARDRNDAARATWPDDPRFDLRAASILEQLRDPAAAIRAWEDTAARHPGQRTEALLKIHHLQGQLGREEAMARTAARLVLSDLTLPERMQLAIATRQRGMIAALARLAGQASMARGGLGHEAGVALTDMLMENGDIGLVVWLRRQRLAVSERVKAVLADLGFGETGHQALPDTCAEAANLRSPDVLLPLQRHLRRPPKPAGWPGRRTEAGQLLLVNGTLGGGGAERQFVALVRALVSASFPRERIDCAFFSLEPDRGFDRFLPDLEALGVRVHDLRSRRVANPAMPPAEAAVVAALPTEFREDVERLWHLVREIAPDTLHGWQDRAGLAAALVGELAGTDRVVASARNLAPDTRGDLRLTEMLPLYRDFLARSNAAFTANAEDGRRDYARWLGTDPARLPLLRNAVDPQVFSQALRAGPRWKPGRPFVLGGVFRLAANKRPGLWLGTVARLRSRHGLDFRPVIFGAGPMQEELMAEARSLGLEDLAIFTDTTDPARIYGSLDVMLLTSRVEGVPNALLEAQACGIAVAACAVGGVPEAVLRRGSGAGLLLAPEITAEAAADQLAGWLPEALSGSAGRRHAFVQRHFSPAAVAAEAMAIYLGTAA